MKSKAKGWGVILTIFIVNAIVFTFLFSINKPLGFTLLIVGIPGQMLYLPMFLDWMSPVDDDYDNTPR